jgi:SAM-dependent methyltransferase
VFLIIGHVKGNLAVKKTGNAEVGKCPNCGVGQMTVFYRLQGVPTNSCILLESAEAARAWPKGEIALASCGHCGFISNAAFDQRLTEYSQRYEETQGFSPTFQRFHHALAEELVERHGLRSKKVIEIGCGKGEFLHLLCALGENRGLGFDPAYIDAREQQIKAKNVEVIADYFSPRYAVKDADFVVCKMTLEHISETGTFLEQIRESVAGSDDTIVFIQVPEATRIFRDCAFEDIYYEHCSYFTAASLASLMETVGFRVLRTAVTYGEQYLTVEARYGGGAGTLSRDSSAETAEWLEEVASFPARVAAKITRWRDDIERRVRSGQRVAIWGSGSKGVSFLNTLGVSELVSYAVDINPHRQGYFMPGGGQRIVAPDELAALGIDYVVVMNGVYLAEVRAMLQERGLAPELAAL